MANIKMDLLEIGQQYSTVQLAHMWEYKLHHPLFKGMVTPSGTNIVIYYGRCFLIDAVIKENSPSEFEFLIENLDDGLDNESDIMDYIVNLPMDNYETTICK